MRRREFIALIGSAAALLSAALFSFNRRIVIERAAGLGLPAIYEWPEMAEEGGLIAYGPPLKPIYRQLALCLSRSSAAPSRETSRSSNLFHRP